MTNRSRKYFARKKEIKALNEDADDMGWLCGCGNYQDDGMHCSKCGGEPPWGCDCSFCNEPEDDEEYGNGNPEFYGMEWLIDF